MRKKFTLFALILFFQLTLSAQAQVQLGSGSSATSTVAASPINIFQRSARSQIVYTAAELNAAGAGVGNIVKLGFYVAQAPAYNLPNFSIKMKHTASSDVAAHDAELFKEVYFKASYAPTAGGFDLLTLDAPFLWNGTDNILIDVCFDIVQPTWSLSGTVRYYNMTNGYRYSRSNSQDMCSIETGSVSAQKPQLLLEFSDLSPNDVGVLSVDEPSLFCPGIRDVVVSIGNLGSNAIDNATVNWEFDGITQAPVIYNNLLDVIGSGNDTAQITLGSKTFAAGQNYSIKAWTSAPNGLIDTLNYNDTLQAVVSSGLAGAYAIGGLNPDYNTFTEAVASLKLLGVCGPVVFNVRNGVYNEQISFPEIPGMDSINTVAFQSESGDSSSVTLSFSASSSKNYVVQLDGADWFVFKRLTIEAADFIYARAVVLKNSASHNRFENCELRGYNTSSPGDGYAVVYSPDNGMLDQYNIFQNNYLRNGSYGFYWLGDSENNLEQGNIMDDNRIENPYYRGIYAYDQDALKVRNNHVYTNSVYSASEGVRAGYCDNNSEFLRNEIKGFVNGLRLDFCDGSESEKIEIVNNFIQTLGTDIGYGIYSSSSADQLILHNSVQVHNTAGAAAAFYAAGGGNNIALNNIFANFGGGYAILRDPAGGVSQSDYNDLYATGPYLGNWEGEVSNLNDWQNASLQEEHSLSVNPLFLSSADFHATQVALNAAGTPVGVNADIESDARDAQTPDVGCDEFSPLSLDAGVAAILPPETPFAPGSQAVAVRIKNFGETTLASLTIEWEHNGIAQPPVNWTGSLALGDTAAVNLGMLNLPVNQAHEITAWSVNPNGMADPQAANDASSASNIYAGLSGVYTLGGSSPDFSNFAEAAVNLSFGGVLGAVTFNVRDGVYNEQVVLKETPGADEINTVTFQSESGDSSLVALVFDANNTDNYTFLLDGADWIRLKKMTLEATNNSYLRVLELRNGASYNTFENCVFRSQTASISSSVYSVIYSGAGGRLDEYNVFKHNTILKGSYGFYLSGIASGNLERGLVIEDNHIDSSNYRGVYLAYMDAPRIKNNLLSSATTNTNSTGLYLEYCSQGAEVSKNKISGFLNRGIHLGNSDAADDEPILIANNFIEISGASTAYGIYSISGSYHKFYHNTVSISSTASSSYGFYAAWGNDKELLNNIFSNTGGGYAIYTNSADNIIRSDYNNLYAAGANLGYWNGNRADLAAWIAASSLDSNSLSLDPLFVSADDLHITNTALDKQGLSLSDIREDVDGQVRDPALPDIGADEITTDPLDAGLYAIDSPATPFSSGAQDVWIRIINNGATTLTSVDIDWEVNGVGQATYNWAGSLAAGQASDSINVGFFNFQSATAYAIKAWTSNPNAGTDGESANDTLAVANLYPALADSYTIGGSSPDFLNFTEAADALTMGGVAGAVTFQVRNGTYNEQISLPEITGASAANTVTFQSESGDSSLVILSYSSPSSDNYTIRLDGADWILFKNLTIEAVDAAYGRAIVLQNRANDNLIENCELRGYDTNNTSDNLAVVFSPDNNVLDENNRFQNCLIRHGSYGVYLTGDAFNKLESGNRIENCRIENAYYRAVYVQYQDAVKIGSNFILSNTSHTDSRAIELNYVDKRAEVSKNQVAGFNYGIRLSNSDGSPNSPIQVVNNFVQTQGTGGQHSIYSLSGSYQRFFHNTVRQLNTNTLAAAFYVSGGGNKILFNNIFANEGGGYAIYRASTDGLANSNYNNLYAVGSYIAYFDTNLENLADWQNATSHDGASFALDPFFLSADSYPVAQVFLNGNASTLGGVDEDVEGETRDAQNPDIGCDEFAPAETDAGVSSVIVPVVPFASGLQPVSATLVNYGTSNLSSAAIHWEVNGVAQTPVNWMGIIVSGEEATVSLGTVDFAIGQGYEIRAWPSQPNGLADDLAINDTAAVNSIYAGLSGAYTIGGVSPDFNTFAEAAISLNEGGVLGSTTFNVRDGAYNEQVALKEASGANAVNTITFQSESGDSSLVALSFNADASTANYTVLLDGADWIRFENMTLEATNSAYGRVLELRNGATQNRFENCAFRGVNTISLNSNQAVIYSPATLDHENAFVNNSVSNGSYGFRLEGDNTSELESGLLIENNSVLNAHYIGLSLGYQEQLLIRSNQIRTTSNEVSGQGISLYDNAEDIEISSNQVVGFQKYGIHLNNSYASLNAPILVANNFVQTHGASAGNGIYSDDGSHQKFYYNSVRVLNNDVASSAFYVAGGNNKEALNNIFANSGGGYAFYREANAGVNISDYNCLYASGSILGYWEGDQAALSDWRSASGQDLHSISEDPVFIAQGSYVVAQLALNQAGTPLEAVDTDIEGDARDPLTPDIGCNEFLPPADDAGIAMVLPPAAPFAPGQHLVRVILSNYGTGALQSVTLNWTLNGSPQTPVNWTGNIASGDTLLVELDTASFSTVNQAYDITAWTSLPNNVADAVAANDSSSVGNIYVGLAGAYAIGGTSPDFNNFGEAASNLNYGGVLDSVAFHVRNGTYFEQIRLKEIAGADSLKTICFQSEAGDSSLVELTYNSADFNVNYTLYLDGTDWISFKKMTLSSSNEFNQRVVHISNGANHIEFSNNAINNNSTEDSYENLIDIESSGEALNEYHTFRDNNFYRGRFAISHFVSSFNGNYVNGLVIENNIFRTQSNNGIDVSFQKQPLIMGNEMHGMWSAVYMYDCLSPRILKNHIYSVLSQGVYLSDVNGAASLPALIANNFIHISESNVAVSGIYLDQGDYLNIYHNSVNITDASPASRAFISSRAKNVKAINNVFANPGGGYAIYAHFFANTAPATIPWSDHNNLYTSGPTLGRWNDDLPDLAAWAAASGGDANSVSVLPGFLSDTDLHINNAALNDIGAPLAEVTDDFDGETRNPINPEVGADEFLIAQNDVAVVSINAPSPPFAADLHPVCVSLFNNGLDTLTSTAINWAVNGVHQPAYHWADVLLPGQVVDSVCIGASFFEVGASYTITTWSDNPNGMADENPQNDTARVENLYAAMGGVYTIGGASPDFPDFSSAVEALINRGLISEVTFIVRNGIYNEQLSIPEILGASAANTITFQSESGDSTAVSLAYNAATVSDNYTLRLDGADWVRFEKMTLENMSSLYARVIDIRNEAENNRFAGNEIIGANIDSSSVNYALVYSGGSKDDDNLFAGNRLLYGSFGIYFSGAAAAALETGTQVKDNRFEDQHYNGMSLYNQDAPVLEGNTITMSGGHNSYDGIFCQDCDNGLRIVKNKLVLADAGANLAGINLQNCAGGVADPGLIANNFVATSGFYGGNGIRLEDVIRQNIYHNNVNVDNSVLQNGIALYLSGGNTLNIVNNVLAIPSNGFTIYNLNADNVSTSDYNDLYSVGANLAYWDGAFVVNLSEWKSLTGLDANSISVDPLFESSADLHVREGGLNKAATPLPEIADDIDGEARDPVSPDIGADEFAPTSINDAGVAEIIHPNKTIPFAAGIQAVDLVIQNKGSDTIASVAINWLVNDNAQATYNWTGFLEPGEKDTVSVGYFDFELKTGYNLTASTSMPDGMIDSLAANDAASVTELYAGLNGVYTIGGLFPDFINFSEAADVLNRGGVLGPVSLNARNGTYNDPFSLEEIRGSGSANTITFQSESGDSSLVKLVNAKSLPFYTVKLNGTDYVTFQNLTIKREVSSNAFELGDGASNIQLMNNRINGDIWSGGNSLVRNLTFRNNAFVGGRISLNGAYGQALQSDILIEGNTFEELGAGAINLRYMDAPAIRSNTIFGQGNDFYSIVLSYCDNGMEISQNKIISSEGGGIYMSYCDGAAGSPGLATNNFIYAAGSGFPAGINAFRCNFQNIYFNNIHAAGTNPDVRAFSINEGGNNKLLNNVLANSAGGYAINATSGGSLLDSDYNDLYSTGPWLGNWLGDNAADLAAWRSASGGDNNSISANPLFYSNTDLHVLLEALDSSATTIAGVANDIDGDIRRSDYPDIGADESDFPEDDVGVIGLTSPADVCDLGNAESVKVVIQNYGGLPQTGFDIAFSLNGGAPVIENVGPLTVQPGDTAHYTFNATADISAFITHHFELATQLSVDLNPGNDSFSVAVENLPTPSLASNMLPVDGVLNIDVPINFSWFPSAGAIRYDLFLWHDTLPKPAMPVAPDLTQINYVLDGAGLVFGEVYKWQVVAKNDYCETPGSVQTLKLRELPDLAVSDLSAPVSPFSGQEIQVSWQVDNNGLGSTGMSPWIDAIYLSEDSIFQVEADLYLGGVSNLTTLNSGQMYAQAANITLPDGIQGDYYIVLQADRFEAVLEEDENNNVSAAAMMVTLTPPPDLKVTSVITPNNAFSGQPINVVWVVKNDGAGDMEQGATYWDGIYISKEEAFNASSATLLASQEHIAPLATDASDTLTRNVVLPSDVFGNYFIHISTDIFNDVFEYVFEDNNSRASDTINVVLTPPPDLVVTSVEQPDSANNRQGITLKWTVKNMGGSTAEGNWVDYIYISPHDVFDPDSITIVGALFRPKILEPDSSYTQSARIVIPERSAGSNYFYISTDHSNSVFEFTNEDNNTGRGNDSTFVKNADLVVSSVSAPATVNSGQAVTISWVVYNNGPGDVLPVSRTDKVFLSDSPSLDLTTATELSEVTYYTSLSAYDSLFRQQAVILPNGISGTYYIHVFTDFFDKVFENQNENNNANQISTTITLSPWPDLQVAALTGLPDSTLAGALLTLNHTVENFGTGLVQSSGWKDRIYISANPVWNPPDAVLLKNLSVLQPMGVGSSYTLSTDFVLPMLGNNAATGVCYIYVYTDGDNDIFEHTDEGNNVLRSNPIYVVAPLPVDLHILNTTTLPDTVWSGQRLNLQWMGQNKGNSTDLWGYPLWYDGVYICEDSIWHPDYEDFVKDFTQQGPLNNMETYTDNQFFNIPNNVSGDYYAFLVADHTGLTNNIIDSNSVWKIRLASDPNSLQAKPIHIKLSPSPNLQANTFLAPSRGLSGQPIELTWTVANIGAAAVGGTWTDKIYLSTDFQIGQDDKIIGAKSQTRTLAPGASYQDALQVFLPSSSNGNYVLIFKTDANNAIVEYNGENNNTFFTYLTVEQPPPSDLVVSNISAGNMAMVGEPFTIDYSIRNEGTNPVAGVMSDLLYFSTDSVFDASDVRFTDLISRNINLAPQGVSTGSATAATPGLPLGEYFIVAHADVLDNIVESNDVNNIRISAQKVMVTVQELLMDAPTTDTLQDKRNLYYRIEIPDSLEGKTLLLTLDALSGTSVNELYLSFGQVPSRANHDFSFNEPFAPDQEVLVPELDAGTYYLLAYGSSAAGNSEQEIVLHAQIINFSIRSIMSNRGGNTGNATVELEGAKFTPDMTVSLEDASLGTIQASGLIFVNSTKAFVTFPLNGAPLGVYDVTAEKPGGEIALLTAGFEVTAGDVGSSTVGGSSGGGFFCNIVNVGVEQSMNKNLTYPAAVRINRLTPITIQFGNSGNVDVPTPFRWLISLRGAPLSFIPNEFQDNKQELYLEFKEPGGPPGILRPGSSSSITVYSFSSHPLRFVLKQ